MRVPTSVWLFLVLTVLTCIIAYWADNLGKNLGKKRISLFGLRPRQTATLISMASSVAIMLLTLLVLSYLSQDFKDALFRSGRLKENNQNLRAENQSLEDRAKQFSAEVAQQKAEVSRSLANTQKARDSLRRIQLELGDANLKIANAKSKLSQAQGALKTAQKKANAAAQRANAAQQRLQNAQRRFQQAEQKARDAESKAQNAQTQAMSANTQKSAALASANAARVSANSARATANKARAAADKAQAASDKANGELQTAKDNLQSAQDELDTTQKNLRQAQAGTRSVLADNETVIKLRERLIADNNQLIDTFVAGNLSITVGQVFAERIIQPDQTASAIRDQLNALQNDALLELKKPPINATIAPLLTLTLPTADNQRVSFDAEKLQHILIENLLSAEVPVAVRWVAARNYAVGEKKIDGRLIPIEVRIVAPEGILLSGETIAGGQSDAAVFNRLLALTDEARAAARERGVTPPLSPQQPNFFAPGTNERVFAALREIQSRGGAARVSLIADTPLSSVAPPAVRFVIEAPENAAASTRAPDAVGSSAPSS